mmetsp:Transcript_8189/g.37198  ORF Transcript_8189/g.37198 Transcript_8189/m.37198 type:complete len:213 (+) Transcript_8189:1359-1997(+)
MTTFGLDSVAFFAVPFFTFFAIDGDFVSDLSFLRSPASAIARSRVSASALARSTSSALTTTGSSRDDRRASSSSSPSTPATVAAVCGLMGASSLLDLLLDLARTAPGRLRRANGTNPPSSGCVTASGTFAGVVFTGSALSTRGVSSATPAASRRWTAPPPLPDDDHASSRSTAMATGPRVTARSLGLERVASCRNPRAYSLKPPPCGADAGS